MSTVEMLQDGSFGIAEARSFSGLGRTALYGLMSQGRLPYVKCGARRLIPKRALIQVLAEGLKGGQSDAEPARKTT